MAKSKKKLKKKPSNSLHKNSKINRDSIALMTSKAIERARLPASKSKKRNYSILSSYIISFISTCFGVSICQSGEISGYAFFIGAIATLIYAFFLGRKNVNEGEYVIFGKISMVISAISVFIGFCMIYYLLTSQQ